LKTAASHRQGEEVLVTRADAQEVFEALVGNLDYPMFVVTASAQGQHAGCLVGFLTQSSIDPPRLLVCLSKNNHTYRVAMDASVLVVHFLGSADVRLARLFGEQTGDETDKFAQCDWDEGPAGIPVLRGCRGWVAGRIARQLELGDHNGFLLDIMDGESRDLSQQPLSFRKLPPLDAGHDA
jgi:flavin reductase (DIM6/NTAB) family NADH-FMN oxidoreductase RutF